MASEALHGCLPFTVARNSDILLRQENWKKLPECKLQVSLLWMYASNATQYGARDCEEKEHGKTWEAVDGKKLSRMPVSALFVQHKPLQLTASQDN
jgi:hypothetical protein